MSSLYETDMTRPQRPLGVAVLTILQILSGLGDIAIGAVLAILAVIAGIVVGGPVATLLFLLDFVVIGLGIFSLIMAYGLWTGKGWAWALSMIGAIIGIILGVVSLIVTYIEGRGLFESLSYIIPTVLYVIMLPYLITGNVRAFFGRTRRYAVPPSVQAQVGQPYMPPTQAPYPQPSPRQPSYPQPQPTTWGPVSRPNCGTPNQPGVNFCDHCGTRLK
jgi:hypothetical protein